VLTPDVAQPLRSNPYNNSDPAMEAAMHVVTPTLAVRRLLPIEAARLQAFPDNYLDIPYRGKPAADSNQYRAYGNTWTTSVVRWIGQRIQREMEHG